MNDLVTIDDIKPSELFVGAGVDALISKIEEEARKALIDVSTEAGRKNCASIAYKISRSKTLLDDMGKELAAEWKARSAKVDAERRKIRDRLDALKDEIRKPLTDFENTESERVAQHEKFIAAIGSLPVFDGFQPTTKDIQDRLGAITSYMQRDWQEFGKRATEVSDAARANLQAQLTARQKYDADQAELQRLRDEQAKRERAAHEEAIRKEAAEAAELAAAKVVAEAKAREEAAQKAANQARQDADKAASDAAAKAKQAQADATEREARAKEAATKAERERIEREQREKVAAAAKREANKNHYAKINNEALEALCAVGIEYASSKAAIEAIAKGQVPHVTISY